MVYAFQAEAKTISMFLLTGRYFKLWRLNTFVILKHITFVWVFSLLFACCGAQ